MLSVLQQHLFTTCVKIKQIIIIVEHKDSVVHVILKVNHKIHVSSRQLHV